MAARDTFEWFVAGVAKECPPELQEYIKNLRMYLITLRSEDERQRFVDDAIQELHLRLEAKPPGDK